MAKQRTILQPESEKNENERKLSRFQCKNSRLKTALPTTKR